LRSIDFFERLLLGAHVVTLPGSSFGPNGEGFIRLSAFERRDCVESAVANIRTQLAS
jgi:LL-diaminopimelate aminotransferase